MFGLASSTSSFGKYIQEEIDRQTAAIGKIEQFATKSPLGPGYKLRRMGDPEQIALLNGLFMSEEDKERALQERRAKAQSLRNELATLSSDRRLIEIARAQSAQKLSLAEQNLSTMQSVGRAPIIVAPSSTSSTSNVNQRFDLGMPASADTERLTVD